MCNNHCRNYAFLENFVAPEVSGCQCGNNDNGCGCNGCGNNGCGCIRPCGCNNGCGCNRPCGCNGCVCPRD